MKRNCLFCYEPLDAQSTAYHRSCSLEFFGAPTPPTLEYGLDQMDRMAQKVIERSIAVPGVQPKLSLSLVKDARQNAAGRLTVVGALGGNYIFKPPSQEFPELPANEHLTMRMAQTLGIPTVPASLIRLASGELSYITKRIDRTETGNKIHMIDMFQATEAFDKYKGSMEKIGNAITQYSANPLLDITYFFDVALFSFLTGNNDMHLKNFSFIQSASGYSLAPAYDLLNVSIALPQDQEELALPLGGKKSNLTRAHFERFAQSLSLTPKQITASFKRLIKNQPKAFELIDRSFLSPQLKNAYAELLRSRYERLFS